MAGLKGRPTGGAQGSVSSEPSDEDVLALLDQLQRADMKELPPELQNLVQQMKAQQGSATAAQDTTETEDITPEPGFVVKTQDLNTGRKVFVNMVGHPRVAAPGNNWSGGVIPEEVQRALDKGDDLSDAEAATLRFPLSTTTSRSDLDKKGEPATVFDCCLNSDVLKLCGASRQLKVFIIELAINWINHKHNVQLDPKYKLPKMRYKGDVVETHRIRMDKKPLVTEVREIQEDPVFPLLTKKPLPPKPTASPAPATASSQPPAPPGSAAAAASRGSAPAASTSGAGQSGFSFSRGQGQAFRQLGAVQLLGKPVDTLALEIEVPDKIASRVRSGGVQAVVQDVCVEVAGPRVWVGAPGCQELEVTLPLAAKSEGARVELDTTRTPFPVLKLQLPYLPVTEFVRLAAAQAPHAPGSLQLNSSATTLELEA